MNLADFISDEIVPIIERAMGNLLEQVEPAPGAALRKLARSYDKLTVEELAMVLSSDDPKVRQLVARHEFQLREE